MKSYKDLISFLGKTLPDGFDAALLDLTEKSCPVLEQTNWSGREIEAVRRFVAGLLRKGGPVKRADGNEGDSSVVNRMLTGGNSVLLKVSVQFFFEGERPVAALCIYMDMNFALRLSHYADKLLRLTGEDGAALSYLQASQMEEPQGTGELGDIPAIVAAFGPAPEDMTPSDRREVCMDLYDAGVFRLKGAIEKTAEALGVSEQTIYRYVSAIRKARN